MKDLLDNFIDEYIDNRTSTYEQVEIKEELIKYLNNKGHSVDFRLSAYRGLLNYVYSKLKKYNFLVKTEDFKFNQAKIKICNDKHCNIRLCKYHWCNRPNCDNFTLVYMQDRDFCRKEAKNKSKKANLSYI